MLVPMKGCVMTNAQIKYESPISSGEEFMPRLKFFKSMSIFKVKVTNSKILVPNGKVLSQGMLICNLYQ